jgi:arylsulfatase A-like enzyme
MHAGRECLDKTRQKYLKHPLVQAWYKENNKDPETINRKDDPAIWLGMGEDLDGRIGAVLDKIRELGIEDNTYVIVVADNGYRHEELQLNPRLKQPLHARKWWLWDGGIRVPMIVRGPGIKPDSLFTGNVVNYDFLPTFVDWAGGDSKKLQNIDGVSLADYMAGKEPDETFLNRNLYFHYPHYRDSVPHSVMISGKYKVAHFYERPDIPMLFDLSRDIGEVTNIAKQNPEIHKKLYDEMMGYLKKVGARFPKVNPDYDLEEYIKDKKNEYRIKWGPFEGQRTLDDDEI